MNLTTRKFAAIAAAAVAGSLLSVPAAQAGDLPLKSSQVDAEQFRANVVEQMQGKAFGWQVAISQNGVLKETDKRGTAISQADNNGTAIPMQPTMRMELASVTKNITAVATLKLLRRNGLTVESKIGPYLPHTWNTTSSVYNLRFRHLLTHTSGINQMLVALPEAQRPTNNSWAAMEFIAEHPAGVVAGSQRQYKNANFAFLRVINANLWNMSGGAQFTGLSQPNGDGTGLASNDTQAMVQVTAANHTSYSLDFMRKHIFQPAGINGVGCITPGTTTGARSYPLNATQASTGAVLGTSSAECAGARGIALSSVELVQYLSALRHGDIIDPRDLQTMDDLRAGWNEDSNGGDGGQSGPANGVADNELSPGVFWHGGDLLGTREVHTCAMTFMDGTEAALLVNSEFSDGSTQCGALIRAYDEARG